MKEEDWITQNDGDAGHSKEGREEDAITKPHN
jgi:hypothetical protein